MFAEALGLQSSPEQPTAPGNMAAPPVAEQPVLQRSASVRKRDALRRWGAIEAAVDEIIAANPAQVEKAKQNPKLAGWFVGQVMKATGGKANPKAVNEIVARKLAL